MVIAILTILGLAWGSFVNALVWRLHEQATAAEKKQKDLSILNGRSMCPRCHHTLAALDLIPLASWLLLRGKCRYCHKPISAQYPLVEALTALIFVGSYIFWPLTLLGAASLAIFGLWLVMVIILMALAIYDLKWGLLPDKLVLSLAVVAVVQAIVVVAIADNTVRSIIYHIIATFIGGGLFYVLLEISRGKWIGGGDVKLGFVLGLIAATPGKAVLLLFLAALAGTLVSLPLLVSKRLKRSSTIPFGPFLILATFIVVLWGEVIVDWYTRLYAVG